MGGEGSGRRIGGWRRLRCALAVGVAASAALVAPAGDVAAADAPVTQRVVLFSSVRGRPVVAYHRYYPGQAARRTVVVLGQTHGDEETGKAVVGRLVTVTRFPSTLDLWLIPTMNPDGDVANTRTNAHRVDLNRNFPASWRYAGAGTSVYSGPRAASEPETAGMMAFLARVKPVRVVSLHTPLAGVDRTAKNPSFVAALSRRTGFPIKTFSCGGGCHGTNAMWFKATQPGTFVVFEFGRTTSASWLTKVTSGIQMALAD